MEEDGEVDSQARTWLLVAGDLDWWWGSAADVLSLDLASADSPEGAYGWGLMDSAVVVLEPHTDCG